MTTESPDGKSVKDTPDSISTNVRIVRVPVYIDVRVSGTEDDLHAEALVAEVIEGNEGCRLSLGGDLEASLRSMLAPCVLPG